MRVARFRTADRATTGIVRTGTVPVGVSRIGRVPHPANADAGAARLPTPFAEPPPSDTAREHRHSVRNLLSNVQAVAAISARSAASMDGFVYALSERIAALGRMHELLGTGKSAVPLRELLLSQLDHVLASRSVDVLGPDVHLPAALAAPLGMAVHELTANALAYGSLSNRDGILTLRWRLEEDGEHQRLRIDWIERGGPPAAQPSSTGFGTYVIERLLGSRFRVERSFAAEGFSAAIEIDLSEG